MNRILNFASGCALASLLAVPTVAQDTPQPRERTARQDQARQTTRQETSRERAGQLDSVTSGANVRVSQLTGMNIQNPQGKAVGEINDLVIDARSGKIRYAAVTYGGFLGIGNKMFAVPWEAFKIQADPNDRDSTVLVLNVTQQQLEGAVGFDEDSWPNFADATFTAEVDKRYGVDRRMRQRTNRDAEVDVDVNRNGVDVDVRRNRQADENK